MSEKIFANLFTTILEQDVVTAPEAGGNVVQPGSEDAFTGDELEDDNLDQLGASKIDPEDEKMLKHAAQREMQMAQSLTEWVEKLDSIVDFLNGTDDNSIQMQLKHSVADTIFDKMRTSEAKKIARVAKEISALAETFKGYLATANDPKYRYV